MRTLRAGIIMGVVLVFGATSPVTADEVRIDQVPAAVKATIERETKGGRLKEIERETKNGRTVYEVEFSEGGKEREIHVAEDGSVIKRDQ